MSLRRLHEWITNIKANPEAGWAPTSRERRGRCFATDGTLIAEGDDVWDGVLATPRGACTQRFE
jgi:hypothetical protein